MTLREWAEGQLLRAVGNLQAEMSKRHSTFAHVANLRATAAEWATIVSGLVAGETPTD